MQYLPDSVRAIELEARQLRREWRHDLSVRWLLALDGAIRRVALTLAGSISGRRPV